MRSTRSGVRRTKPRWLPSSRAVPTNRAPARRELRLKNLFRLLTVNVTWYSTAEPQTGFSDPPDALRVLLARLAHQSRNARTHSACGRALLHMMFVDSEGELTAIMPGSGGVEFGTTTILNPGRARAVLHKPRIYSILPQCHDRRASRTPSETHARRSATDHDFVLDPTDAQGRHFAARHRVARL